MKIEKKENPSAVRADIRQARRAAADMVKSMHRDSKVRDSFNADPRAALTKFGVPASMQDALLREAFALDCNNGFTDTCFRTFGRM